MKKPTKSERALKPCPLCGGKALFTPYGISCEICGLWLGDGSQVGPFGGFKRLWNRRMK